jgi:hypothetical protein
MQNSKFEFNSIGKHSLKYLAELLVVVIGVYIGFKANNYAEEQKQKEYVLATIKEMYKGLEEDAKDAEGNRNGHLKGQKAVNYFLKLANNNPVNKDSFEFYLMVVLTRNFVSIQNTSPFETIKSKGFNLITNDSLRQKMIKLYDFQYEFLEKLEEDYQETQFYSNESNHINEILAPSIVFNNEGKFMNLRNPLVLNEKDKNRLILILKRINFNRKFIASLYDGVITDIRNLRKQIEKEYPFVLEK